MGIIGVARIWCNFGGDKIPSVKYFLSQETYWHT